MRLVIPVLLSLIIGPAAAMDIETVPEVDLAFSVSGCVSVLNTTNVRCKFTALAPNGQTLRIPAYSLRMKLWAKDKLIRIESIPNGDLDSGDSYRHLIRSESKITKISIEIP